MPDKTANHSAITPLIYLVINTDDLMASGETDSDGRFLLEGSTDEITTIDPKLNIYHDCADGFMVMERERERERERRERERERERIDHYKSPG